MATELHVVAFDTPYPANYGGAIDVYYRLRALHEAGVKVRLHCYEYVRPPAVELEELCAEVHYYHRPRSVRYQLSREPFIVATRRSDELRQRLMQDRLPILLEGIHCSALLHDEELRQQHPMWLRMHNVEADYYRRLAQSEPSPLQRLYLALEAAKLRRYEPPTLLLADRLFAISHSDARAARAMGAKCVVEMPSALPSLSEAAPPTGMGSYALFHGNLSVGENSRVAEELIQQFATLEWPLVVAGHAPSARLRRMAEAVANVRLVSDPTDDEMTHLVAEAQVCLMFTHQPTGLKQKLLRSLCEGRHCVANAAMVEGTSLGELCHVVEGIEVLPTLLPTLMSEPFSEAESQRRVRLLQGLRGTAAIRPLLEALHDFTSHC